MSKVYSYEQAQEVISEAFNLAVKHLEDRLGDQYKCWNTDDARSKFYDKVAQDIEFMMTCDRCGKVDDECNFTELMVNSEDLINVCYACYEEINPEDES